MARHDCPKCLGSSVTDSRLRYYEFPYSLICLKPYRCADCNHRFWRFSDRMRRKALPYAGYALLALFGLIAVWQIFAAMWSSK
jgi:hypothetical protein